MNNDIRFYDFDFNLLYILPPFSQNIGYSAVNATMEMNNSGSFETLFCDDELKSIVEQHKDTILVVWRDFQGFLTSYKFDTQYRLFGMSLNGLLHRVVIPSATEKLTGTVEALARSAIETALTLLQDVSWLNLGEEKGFTNQVTYQTETYMRADEYIQNLLALDNAGYMIKADFTNKKFVFELIKSKENELILSENNLNAYDIESGYNNKNLAFGGWYKEKQVDDEGNVKVDSNGNQLEPVWKYITLNDTVSGVYKIDTVLKAETATEAENELKTCKPEYEFTAKTRDIYHNVDYSLGDIIRVQNEEITTKRVVSGISMWNEGDYSEQPILTESEGI